MLSVVLTLLLLTPPVIEIDFSQLSPEAKTAISAQQQKSQEIANEWFILGMLYHAHDLDDASISAYTYSDKLKSNPKPRYLLGIALARTGEYERAIQTLENVKDYTPAIWRQGFWYMDLGDLEKASKRFETAIEIDTNCVPAIIGLTRTHLAKGNPREAIVLLDNLISRGGNHPYVLFLLGTAHRRAGNNELASQFLKVQSNGPPTWTDPWFEEMQTYKKGYAADLARAMAMIDVGNITGAKKTLEALALQHPKEPALLNNLATVYLQLRQVKLAEDTIKKSMRWSPKYAPSYLTMAYIMRATGKIDLALEYAKKAIELQASMSQAHALAGKLSFQKGDMPSASSFFSKAIELGNSDPNIREMYGMVLLNTGNPRKALQEFELVLKTSPKNTGSISGKCIAIALLGDPDTAIKLLAQAKIDYPDDPRIQRAWQSVLKIKGNQ
jgi:tetratricopeptide (TPR) repeat protein